MTRRNSLVSNVFGVYAGSSILATGITMIAGLLTARFVEPSALGLFNGMGLVLAYAPIAQFGVINGLNRELPFFIGRGNKARAEELASTTQAWAIVVGSLFSSCLTAVSAWHAFRGNWTLASGWLSYALGVFILFFATSYLRATYRTSGDFKKLAIVQLARASFLLMGVALVHWFRFYGLCLRYSLAAVAALILLWIWRPIRVAPRLNFGDFKHLLSIGLPIFLVGLFYSWWTAFDKTLVLNYMGTEGLGLYAIALLTGTSLILIPQAVSQITYPRMAEQYGRTRKIGDLISITKRPILLMACVCPFFVVAGWFLVPLIVKILLPKYVSGIQAAQWTLIATSTKVFLPVANIFNVTRNQIPYSLAIGGGIVGYASCLYWLARDGFFLAAFPQAMIAGNLIFTMLCYIFVFYLSKKQTKRIES